MQNLMVETEWEKTVPPAECRIEACEQGKRNDLRASRPAFA
ncbi:MULTISPECIES: hypothetical protein [Burkholderia]|nr:MULTISPECIES: hypothetical protein [Burkholderia]